MSTIADYTALIDLRGYDGVSTAHKTLAINAARRRLVHDRRWRFLESVDATLDTVALDDEVSLSTLTDLAHVDAVRPVQSGEERETAFLSVAELRHEQAARPQTGLPRYWTRRNATLLLHPTPDLVYPLTVEYVALLADLSGAIEDTVPENLQDLVVTAAIKPLAFRQRDAWAFQAAEGEYQMLLRQAGAQENVQQRQASRQVRSGYWGHRDHR